MPQNISVPREHEDYSATRVVRRSRLFFVAPIVIIVLISANLVWEIIRANLHPPTLNEWPLRFTVINASTTATILAVFVGLFMGRLQWAHALKPVMGSAIDDEKAQFRRESNKWRFWLFNAGPGGAVIDTVLYYARFVDQAESEGAVDWVSLSIVNDQFRARNLADGFDYFLRWYTKGAPFPVVKNYSEGMQLGWFTVETLAQLRVLDVKVRYIGSLGDSYEKIIPIMHRMPTVAVAAVRDTTSTKFRIFDRRSHPFINHISPKQRRAS